MLRREDAGARIAACRGDRRVVFTNGCFDILHAGHADLLARARERGDMLVVGVNSDASVRRLKGDTRPLNPEDERMFVLASLACVDFVTLFDEDTPFELISEIRPNVLIKGGDWPVEAIVGRDIVQADGGEVLSLPLKPGFSTTGLVRKILATCGCEAE
ncbi:D-glycero-beta-D-manno-heptose 1-phosphate adenylyltransferase [Desulfobaculum xiamenense]|nr:D-glycero-beta-D-manno-heptose 1-phosphate adenylyltransferase [Desulfobaculum xiamenense]